MTSSHMESLPLDPAIAALLTSVQNSRKAAMIADMLKTVIGLGEDNASIADLKLFRRALAEMRHAAQVFTPYREIRKVAVFGSARTSPETPEYQLAMEFARQMVEHGYMIITGGGNGIMGAAQKGAGAEKSFGLNIRLPFEQSANPTIDGDPKLINFNYFFTRKLNFMKETHAFVLLPGGFGTQDEGFESLTLMQTGKSLLAPIILLERNNGYYWETWRRFLNNDLLERGLISPSDFHLFRIVHSPEEACAEITKFYSTFHSYRWVRERMVIRINHPIKKSDIDILNERFQYLLIEGTIEQRRALPEEKDDIHLAEKPRLVLTPTKKNFGQLRLLIEAINTFV